MSADKVILSRAYAHRTKPAGDWSVEWQYNMSIHPFVCTFVCSSYAIFVFILISVRGSSVVMYSSQHWGLESPAGSSLAYMSVSLCVSLYRHPRRLLEIKVSILCSSCCSRPRCWHTSTFKIYQSYILMTMPHLTISSYVEPTCTELNPLDVKSTERQYNISFCTPVHSSASLLWFLYVY